MVHLASASVQSLSLLATPGLDSNSCPGLWLKATCPYLKKSLQSILQTSVSHELFVSTSSLIQWSVTILSLHPWSAVIWYLSSAVLTLPTRLAAMCTDTSSILRIVRFFFANLCCYQTLAHPGGSSNHCVNCRWYTRTTCVTKFLWKDFFDQLLEPQEAPQWGFSKTLPTLVQFCQATSHPMVDVSHTLHDTEAFQLAL